ncbi:type IV secretory system conjugative DNA transfer family protein [Muricauda sp. SCSIO 64092]|uniref:type IV secretory system conjugative DNA transfer family protein n=1 Tax=Allomuricauda sp. SCSIO 64092 TaxID=2908842 RepID=UPI001FF2F3FF|nr:type IV secretory system conjugative DNA transfer family protein [Muricauda sp. SCSIO 64092]UOY05013.1 type IV secretory system conjugative DNA transfer family protein [Muricauda sp. SCSIO 64092]
MKEIADIFIDIISGTLNFVADGIEGLDIGGKKHTLNASFEKRGKLFSQRHGGFAIGVGNHLSVQQSHNHVMCVAPSGAGKTTCIIIPTIINIATAPEGASMVIADPKRELAMVEPFLRYCGYTVVPFDIGNPDNSICFNPLARANNSGQLHTVIQRLVYKQGERNENDFWSLESIKAIHTFARKLKSNAPVEFQNPANIYYLLEEMMGNEELISNMFASESEQDIWRKYRALVANSDRTKSSILASATSNLSFIGLSPDLCDITSTDTFDFSRLRSEKIALILRCPLQSQDVYSSIFGVFYSQLFDFLFSALPQPNDRKIFMLIDELANIPMPDLASIMTTARSYFAILGILQSENQLKERYGEYNAKTILNNCTRVYMTGLDEECERLERTLGSYTYFNDKEKENSRTRPLMTSDEIRCMPKDRVLVFPNGGMRPIYLKVTPYYKVPKLVRYMNMEHPDGDGRPSTRRPTAYLPLDQYRNIRNE